MKSQHTKVKWILSPTSGTYYTVHVKGKTIAKIPVENGTHHNAELIAEAGTVANEIGFSPRQLADQKSELLEALKAYHIALGQFSDDYESIMTVKLAEADALAERVIQKVTS